MNNRRPGTKAIIFHHSLSHDVSAFTIDKWHKERGFSEIGYHFVIRKDGTIEIGRDVKSIGAHAKGRNLESIGVCLTGNFSTDKPTSSQIASCVYLYWYLCNVYKKELKLEFHRSTINPCPGTKFNRKEFKKIINNRNPNRIIKKNFFLRFGSDFIQAVKKEWE